MFLNDNYKMLNDWFKNRNILNIPDTNKFIYRIIPMVRLEQMLRTKQNTLVKIKLWEDPYENFFFKENFINRENHEPIGTDYVSSKIYGQCWSLFKDSDALWRIYSPDKQCVRIRTTIAKLYNSVYIDDNCMATTYIGSVDYKNKKDLISWIKGNEPISMSNINDVSVNSLFLKRNNFSHEKEVRVIYLCPGNVSDNNEQIKQYNIDPLDFIEEISFDPRCNESYYAAYKSYLSKKYSYPLAKINKSHLYRFTPIAIEI